MEGDTCIDALLRPLAVGELVEALDDALLVEVDCHGAACLGHAQALRQMVDGDDLLGSEQNGAADRHLADGAAAPNRHGVGRRMSHCTAACQPVGKMSPRKRTCSSGIPSGTLI